MKTRNPKLKSNWQYIDEKNLSNTLDSLIRSGHHIISVQRTTRLLFRCYLICSWREE